MSTKEINGIRSEIGDLKRRVMNAHERLKAAQMRHAGVKVGDRIRVLHDKVCWDFDAEIIGWNSNWNVKGKPVAVKIKKDGTAGMQSAGYIGSWQKVLQE